MDMKAVPVELVRASCHSTDGTHVILNVKLGGQDLALAVPPDQAEQLALACLSEVAECRRKTTTDSSVLVAMDANRFELSREQGSGGAVVLSMTVANGAVISFRLPQGMIAQMFKTFAILTGSGAPSTSPGSTLQ